MKTNSQSNTNNNCNWTNVLRNVGPSRRAKLSRNTIIKPNE